MMRKLSNTIVSSVVAFSVSGHALAEDKAISAEDAKAMTSKWIKNLKDNKLAYGLGGSEYVFTSRFSPGTPMGDVTALTLNVDGSATTIAFKGKVTEKHTLQHLRENFLYVAMDKVATPGLNIPGWAIKPMTSTSSFKKGVTVDNFENGQLKFTVKGSFFATSGSKKNILVPADAPMPADAYFRISKPLDFEIQFSANLKEKEKAPGNINLPNGYNHKRLRGIDSTPGEIKKEGGLTIRYEIGRVTPPGQPRTGGSFSDSTKRFKADQLAWFKTTKINDKTVNMAFTKDSLLLLSYPADGINFNVKVAGEEQLAEALMILLSYP